jgi:TupA-like ATPgrasp
MRRFRRVASSFLTAVRLYLKRSRLARFQAGRCLIDLVLWPSDVWKVCSTYRRAFDRSPRLLRPRTFNERLQRAKLFSRKARHMVYADKIAVREYVAAKVGAQHLSQVFWIGTDIRRAQEKRLPSRFVVKANHSCGANIIVTDVLQFDWDAAHRLTQQWLQDDYSVHFAEWQYRWIKPRLFIEEFVESGGRIVPVDYKFFCFHGRAEIVWVHCDRFTNHTRSVYDREFNLLPVAIGHARPKNGIHAIARPECFYEMRHVAERLADREPFLRVDLYDAGKPVFGELTLHPLAGLGRFEPPDWDVIFGRFWQTRHAFCAVETGGAVFPQNPKR